MHSKMYNVSFEEYSILCYLPQLTEVAEKVQEESRCISGTTAVPWVHLVDPDRYSGWTLK